MDPPPSSPSHEHTVPVVEEKLRLSRRLEETGAVRVRLETEAAQADCEIPTSIDEVEVQRVPINAVVDVRREPRIEDGALVVPVYEEVFERRLVLREEIRLVRRESRSTERRSVSLHRERAVIERRQPDGSWQPVEPDIESAADGERRGPAEGSIDVPTHTQE